MRQNGRLPPTITLWPDVLPRTDQVPRMIHDGLTRRPAYRFALNEPEDPDMPKTRCVYRKAVASDDVRHRRGS